MQDEEPPPDESSGDEVGGSDRASNEDSGPDIGGDPADQDAAPDTGDLRQSTEAETEEGQDPGDEASAVTDVDDLIGDSGNEDADGSPSDSQVTGAGTEQRVTIESSADRSGSSSDERATSGSDSEESRADRDPDGRQSGSRSEAELEREILDAEERIGPSEDYCRHCGTIFSVGTDTCPECGSQHPRSVDPPASTYKHPQLSAALSVLPGLGHLYNEQYGRGVAAFVGFLLVWSAIAFLGLFLDVVVTLLSLLTLSPLGTAILVLAVLFGWILSASVAGWDAYGQARELNSG